MRVIDLATTRAELAGRQLADLGAEVIKVEPPEGAEARRMPPFEDGREDDPDGSLYWATVGLGKRSVVLDLELESDRERLRALAASADIFIESFDPGTLDAIGLGQQALREANPGLVYVSVTPYGQTGPDAHSPSSDLTLQAAGGLISLQGDGDRPPVPVGYPQAAFHAGLQAAADAVIALNERDRSGRGQFLDVSMQAAIIWTLMQATGFPSQEDRDPPNRGDDRAEPLPETIPGVEPTVIHECADGYIVAGLGVATALRAGIWPAALRLLREQGDFDEAFAVIEEPDALPLLLEDPEGAEVVRRAYEAITALFRRYTKRELMEWATRERLLLAPMNTVADLLEDPQLLARDYWRTVGGRTHPGPPVLLGRTPMVIDRPAPSLGADQNLVEDLPRRAPAAGSPNGSSNAAPRGAAFAGVRVADFAWVGVGPLISKALADHGATVVHVESASRPDVLRLGAPFKDGIPGLDRAQFMANFNSSKQGLALDLKTSVGRALARRLVDWADVVVESFTPGTMARLGLDYETVARDRPELIMLSTCLRGQTGPMAGYRGFGQQGSAQAGLHGITGWPDRPAHGTWGAYTDFVAPRYGVAALVSAIYERHRSGLGQHIDMAQVEAGIHFIEPLILDYTVNGRLARAAGHDSATACPNGVYAVAGTERYIAISVETAEQWQALRSLAPLDGFTGEELETYTGRLARRDEIDEALRAWTGEQDGYELAARLKQAGVPASAVQRPSDLYRDPQVAHREFFVTLDHSVMGPTPYDGLVTRFSDKPVQLLHAAPALGEHTQYVLSEYLGLSDEQIAEHAAAGVLS